MSLAYIASVLVLFLAPGVLSTCVCPDRYASDNKTLCTKVVSLDPCSCKYSCISQPVCTFPADEASCLARSINGLTCSFKILDATKCSSSCACSTTTLTACNFTGSQIDCFNRDPNCKFSIVSSESKNCQSSCACPAKPLPCDFTDQTNLCSGQGCTLKIIDSTPGKCQSSCNCSSSTTTRICDTSSFSTYQAECVARTGCTFSSDPLNCNAKCSCVQNSISIVQVPASCDLHFHRQRCLSTPSASCTFSVINEFNSSFACSCVSQTGVSVAASCDVEYYRQQCTSRADANCEFARGDPNQCYLGCYCTQK